MKRTMRSHSYSRRIFLSRMSAAVGANSGLVRTVGPV